MTLKQKSTVGLVRGGVRYDNILKSLEIVHDSVVERLSRSMRIVIKPDFFLEKAGMCTSADSVTAVLDFVLDYTNKKVTIAEGLYSGSEIQPVFHKTGLHELADDYGLRYVDLNRDEFITVSLGNDPFSVAKGSKLSVRVAKTVISSDFRISLAVPKLAGTVFYGASASMAIGSVISSGPSAAKNDKARLLSSKRYSADVVELLKLIHPHLSVVDGFESAVGKRAVGTNFCTASADCIASDVTSAVALGNALNRKIRSQKYLEQCSKAGIGQSSLSRIVVAGEKSFR